MAQNEDYNIFEELKKSVQAIIDKTGPNSRFAQDLLTRIGALQMKLDTLSDPEKLTFVQEMKGSFRQAIDGIEKRLAQHTHIQQTYGYSILMAVIFILVSVFALFGFKLYKSLTEKELKKQEKLKTKQLKKAKKSN